MDKNLELKALKEIKEDLDKLYYRAVAKGQKEREKANEQYVVIKGERYYSENDIMEAYACDMITSSQCDKYMEKLEKKKEIDWGTEKTLHEYISSVYLNYISNVINEIDSIEFDLLPREEKEAIFRAREEELDKQDRRMLEVAKRRCEEIDKIYDKKIAAINEKTSTVNM